MSGASLPPCGARRGRLVMGLWVHQAGWPISFGGGGADDGCHHRVPQVRRTWATLPNTARTEVRGSLCRKSVGLSYWEAAFGLASSCFASSSGVFTGSLQR